MNRKSWKTSCTALKTTFTTDETHLHTPLGNQYKNNPSSQNWITCKDKEDNLYMAPLQRRKTWTAHKLIGVNKSQGLIHDTKGSPSQPPEKAVNITLRSQTKHTYIFNNSNAAEVLTRHPEKR